MTSLIINGQPLRFDIDPQTPLLWALRDAANLTGTKYGCGTGDCGACTVEIDGHAILSCQVSIRALEGAFITTIEGLSNDRSHPVQQAWVAENVTQCGFCDPGMIMAASVLLKQNKNPSDAQIDAALPHVCPCGVLPRVRRAVKRAAAIMAGSGGVAPVPPPDIPPAEAARAVPALKARP
ncbi:MAG: (2Fe-2S)-binding protein [Alphaproteobacteria bacterium]|nr:(2Fe-2S)-binding protein [Alphaproteobacteria bacterium]